jgi:hypothetical protein
MRAVLSTAGSTRGEVNGKMGAWPLLVEEWLFDLVQAKLSDPAPPQADWHPPQAPRIRPPPVRRV